MNLLLLHPDDFINDNHVQIRGRRLLHLKKVIKAKPGDYLKAGRLNGKIGRAELLSINSDLAELSIELTDSPPPALPINLILALP